MRVCSFQNHICLQNNKTDDELMIPNRRKSSKKLQRFLAPLEMTVRFLVKMEMVIAEPSPFPYPFYN